MSEYHDHVPTYTKVFIALMILTALTVAVAELLGDKAGVAFGIFVGLAIAVVKGSLVALYFMHLKYEVKSTWSLVAIPMVLLLLLMFALMPDIAGVV